MKKYTRRWLLLAAAWLAVFAAADPVQAQSPDKGSAPLIRLFFEDHKACTLRWADVRTTPKGQLSLEAVKDVEGFKKLDPAKQKLVQMRESNGLVMVGVRDNEAGVYESGWVLVHTGVGYAEHGDHGDWRYKKAPQVCDSRLDKNQGNPAHLYVYDGCFFLANDMLGGYTRLDPRQYATNDGREVGKGQPRFLGGGGNHITLAVVEDKVGYSSWIDYGGPDAGRVDVTPVTDQGRPGAAYSFYLPTGGIHGAATNAGKVFLAPADGICWVQADMALALKGKVKVHHISLGKDGDHPRRTGAFANQGPYVFCVTGKDDHTSLVLLDAREAEPRPLEVSLHLKRGSVATPPAIVATPEGKGLAFVFHDHEPDVDVADMLEIVALNPSGETDYKNAKSIKLLPVGKSAVEGHYGHHGMAFDAENRFAFFTNPGDGTVSVLSLKSLEVVASFNVGGMPTHLVARGGRETED